MFVYVKLLNGFQKPLVYQIPAQLAQQELVHRIIKVPLQKRFEFAVVFKQTAIKPFGDFAIRAIESLVALPHDAQYQQFLSKVAAYHQLDMLSLMRRLQGFLSHEQEELVPTPAYTEPKQLLSLLPAQQEVVDSISGDLYQQCYSPTLLHGVTGSGKTEVYAALIRQTIALGKSVILLCPEVSLSLQLQNRLTARLPDIAVYGFHSASKKSEREQLWQALCDGKPCVIIGVHLPVLLPIAALGFIIVDEEHEVGYQEKKHPKLNSKEIALLRAHHYKLPILLGSATPSIASLYNVKTRGWRFCQLTERYKGSFPTVRVVQLDKSKRSHFFISKELQQALAERLLRSEQSILFLNRRGYSFFVQCDTCDHIVSCDSCSVSLTLHEDHNLRCHYCGFQQLMEQRCTKCAKGIMLRRGLGTQQVVEIVKKLFPQARIARADLDVTASTAKWKKTLEQFEKGELDILIGTQTVTKGYHFPRVTLVGVIWADVNLHFPVYNAQEVALQQLLQVIGRSGRAEFVGEAIVQTIEQQQLYQFLDERTYIAFYEQEIESRELVGYPPCKRLAEIELQHETESMVQQDALRLAVLLRKHATEGVTILGPALPPVAKLKNAHRRRIYIKANDMQSIIRLLSLAEKEAWLSQLYFTPNPLS